MRQLSFISICLLICTFCFSQQDDKVYLAHYHNYGFMYSYDVTEFIIHPDSTYTRKDYTLSNKRDWRNYNEYPSKTSKGRITKHGNFFKLREYRNGHKTDFYLTAKIKDRKLIFFYQNRKGKLKRGYTYKRINQK